MTPQRSTQSLPGEVLSPSQASLFLRCSAAHWFRYGLGLPDPSGGGAVRGKATHAVIEYWMRAKLAGVRLGSSDVMDVYERAWDDATEDAQFQAYDDVEQLKLSGAVLAQTYLSGAAPSIEPAAVEVPFTTRIAGVPVRGVIDMIDTEGTVIDIKTSSRKTSKLSADHQLQLATYAHAVEATETRLDTVVATRDPQLVQIAHTPGAAGKQLVERMYPAVVAGIEHGLYLPNRGNVLCSRRHCNFWGACEREFGGEVVD